VGLYSSTSSFLSLPTGGGRFTPFRGESIPPESGGQVRQKPADKSAREQRTGPPLVGVIVVWLWIPLLKAISPLEKQHYAGVDKKDKKRR